MWALCTGPPRRLGVPVSGTPWRAWGGPVCACSPLVLLVQGLWWAWGRGRVWGGRGLDSGARNRPAGRAPPPQGSHSPSCVVRPPPLSSPAGSPHALSLQSSLMDLADVFTAPAPPAASDPWGGPAPVAAAIPAATSTSDPWGGPPAPPAADPWGGPAPTPASGDPWRPAAPAGPSVDPWGGTQAPAAGEGPTPDPWGSSDGERSLVSGGSRDATVQRGVGWVDASGRAGVVTLGEALALVGQCELDEVGGRAWGKRGNKGQRPGGGLFRGGKAPPARGRSSLLTCLFSHPGGVLVGGPPASDPWAPAPAFSDPWGGSPAKPSTNGTAGTGWAPGEGLRSRFPRRAGREAGPGGAERTS